MSTVSPPVGIALTVLGSGGPMHGGGRGSAAYLLRLPEARPLVVDMGGDTPHALARAGLCPGEVGTLLISHLHPDHVSGPPDFVWGELTADRSAPLLVLGPPAAEGFPDMEAFWQRLFGPQGAFPFLSSLVDNPPFPLTVSVARQRRLSLGADGQVDIAVYPVHHGRAPTLAFRIDAAGVSVVLAGDQVMRDPAFVDFARGAELMVAHMVVSGKAAGKPLADVVCLPEDIGRLATLAGVQHLVLSHLMLDPGHAGRDSALWSLAALEEALADVRAHFRGKVSLAEDLAVYRVA